jgi:hypothetical protein
VRSATVLKDPVRRRPGVELADAWDQLRRQVEERPGGLGVTVRVRRDRLDMFLRLNASHLAELPDAGRGEDGGGDGEGEGQGEWVTVRLSYGIVREARQLLQFADGVEVVEPPEVRAELAAAAVSITELYAR